MHLLMLLLITEHFRAAAFHFLSLGFLGVFLPLLLKNDDTNNLTASEVNLLIRKAAFNVSHLHSLY